MRSIVVLGLAFTPSAVSYCPPPGALLPPPTYVSSPSRPIIAHGAFKDLEKTDTSFSVKAMIGDTEVFSHAYLAPAYDDNNVGVDETLFRIGSVTKVMTVLAVILSKGRINFDDSIRKFVPELVGDIWEDVTIASLASHTSGLGRFGFVGDLAVVPGFNPAMLGIPPVKNTHPGCDIFPGGKVCSHAQVIDMLNHPSKLPHSPNSRPLYSNIGFDLLGMALEKAHSKTYEDVIQELILDPLKMTKSTFVPPTDRSSAILPQPDDRWFVANFANYNPTGGLWCTPNELQKFFRAVLNHDLLSAADTRKWLQPHALASSVHQAIGAPWEILRPTELDIKFPRAIDIYTKSGGVEGYAGYGAIVPEFDLSITITAGGNSSTPIIEDIIPIVMKALIPYADELARDEAAAKYAGTYSLPDSECSITLTLDDGPGIAITSFTMNGVPVLESFATIRRVQPDNLSVRVFPTDPDSLSTDSEFWWMNMDTKTTAESFSDMKCVNWMKMDQYRYAREPLDAVKFVMEDGKAVGIELIGWRTTLERQATSDWESGMEL